MLRMLFTVFNLCPTVKYCKQYLTYSISRIFEYKRSHTFTDVKGLLLMTCKFLDFRRMQDIKFREMDREMRYPIYNLSETHQSSLLGSALEKSRSLS